ncbi:alpha-glucosidase [Nesidiocoris tenuis]|uniref:alpha-glucosidase n=1 Tax=Nesidiocoris tenuis TaxID=355587 RepID=A0ABN7B194_9HEMI|nr:alpha-glucosidase [Nesidiocoris tenuis]
MDRTLRILSALVWAVALAEPAQWWEVGPIYQIYPASFADSDGDGIGDLNGIRSHVDHFADIGLEAVWLSPIFDSPMRDNGYDISDYEKINPMFGTMEDFQDLVTALHGKGIKLMLDLVPNHTSNDSAWFQDSVNQRNNRSDWYVWQNPGSYSGDGSPMPPNNWVSLFGGSAWTYNEVRKQYYLHQFGDFQPDMNYENEQLREAMKNVIRFWLGKGVDGFRVDAVPYIAETNYTSNEPVLSTPGCDSSNPSYDCLDHTLTKDQPYTFDVLKMFAQLFEEQNSSYSANPKVQFLEAYTTLDVTMKYYSNHSNPFNFLMISNVNENTNATTLNSLIQQYMQALPANAWPNWVTGNHDNPRIGTRMGSDLIDAMNMMDLLLPGTPVTYNGEEIGMTDGFIMPSQRKDTANPSRDPERTPMQWNSTINAGFSTNTTSLYLPINPNYWQINVDTETKQTPSHLTIYKDLVTLNKKLADNKENLSTTAFNDWVFAFKRSDYVVVINLNNEVETFQLKDLKLTSQDSLTVEIPSLNAISFKKSQSVSTSANVTFTPRSGVVFSLKSSGNSAYISFFLLPISAVLTFIRC